jgi:hypothetical protein
VDVRRYANAERVRCQSSRLSGPVAPCKSSVPDYAANRRRARIAGIDLDQPLNFFLSGLQDS